MLPPKEATRRAPPLYGDPWHGVTAAIVAACRANGVLPVDGPFGDFSDPDGFTAQARRAATLGMVGKWAIHPNQVALANAVFTPPEAKVAEAREILAAMTRGRGQGPGRGHLQGPPHRHRLGPPGAGDRADGRADRRRLTPHARRARRARPLRARRRAPRARSASRRRSPPAPAPSCSTASSTSASSSPRSSRCAWRALLARPDDERYPFGYLFFEPLINTVKGLLILGVSLFALVDAADRARHRRPRRSSSARRSLYAAFATVTCLAVVALRCAGAAARARWSPPTSRPGRSTPRSRGGVLAGFLARRRASSAPATPAPPATSTRRWSPSSSSSPSPCRCAWPAAASCALLNRAPAAPVVAGMEAARPRRARRPAGRAGSGSAPSSPAAPPTSSSTCWCPPGTALDLAAADRLRGARHRRPRRPPRAGHRRRRLHRRRGLRRPDHRLSQRRPVTVTAPPRRRGRRPRPAPRRRRPAGRPAARPCPSW